MPERTIVLLKPDAVIRGLVGSILSQFELKGFKILGLKMVLLTDELLYALYPSLREKRFHDQVKKAMQIAPCVAVLLEGEGAINRAVALAGASKNAEINEPFSIRGQFAMWTGADVIHRAMTQEEASGQIALFFSLGEQHTYRRAGEEFLSQQWWDELHPQ